jgi:uncharacterized alkaline shock family protein YloU
MIDNENDFNKIKNEIIENSEKADGEVKISDEVILVIASNSAASVEGVHSMSGGIAGDIAVALGKKSLSKGVKLERDENKLKLELFIVVEYGVRIPNISWEVQEVVKREIEDMTGLDVREVNIHIQGIHIEESLVNE